MKKNILKITLIGVITLTGIEMKAVTFNPTIVNDLKNESITETFKVYGNCGMCEKTIEGSLKGVKGIEKADWNKDTKMMEVVYHTHDISLDEIKKKIAAVGYDTEEYRATDKAYNNLAGCCHYERPENKKEEDHSGHKH